MLWFNTHEEEQTLKWLKNIEIDNLSDSDRKIFVTALQKFLDKLNPVRERYEQKRQQTCNDMLTEALREYNEHYGKTTWQDYNQTTKTGDKVYKGQRGNET